MTFHPRANCGLGSTELHARILVEVGGWIDFYLEMSPCWGKSSSSDTQCFQFIVIHFGNKLIGWSPVDACGMVDDFCFTSIQGNVGKLGLVVFIGTGSEGGRGKGQCQKRKRVLNDFIVLYIMRFVKREACMFGMFFASMWLQVYAL